MVEMMLSPSQLQPNRFNPNVMAPEDYQALKADMLLVGPKKIDAVLASPFEVFYGKKPAEGEPPYVVVDGQNRHQSATELLWIDLRVDVQEITEEEAKGICYRKSKERGTIDPFKEAVLFKSEADAGLTQKAIAEKFLVDASTVSHRISLLKLVPEVREQIEKLPRGTVTTSHLEPIASLPEGEQKKFELKYQWSQDRKPKTVEQITAEVKQIKENLEKKQKLKETVEKSAFKACPKCGGEPVLTWKGLPWVDCSSGNSRHTWNLETGKGEYQQETHTDQTLDGKKSEPVKSSVLRCGHTVKELSQTFESRVKETLPKLKKIEHIQIRGLLEGDNEINLEFSPGFSVMSISLRLGGDSAWFRAEDKAYRTGEKSKVDTYSPEHVESIQDFIDAAFAGKLEVPEKRKKPVQPAASPAICCVICGEEIKGKSVTHDGDVYDEKCAMLCNLPGYEADDDALNSKARAKREQLRREGKVCERSLSDERTVDETQAAECRKTEAEQIEKEAVSS